MALEEWVPDALKNSRWIARQFIEWQAPSGGVDIERCKYAQPQPPWYYPGGGELCIPDTTVLYRFYEITGDETYKKAADRYLRHYVTFSKENPTYVLWDGKTYTLPTWQYSGVLLLAAEHRRYNPSDDSLLPIMDEFYEEVKRRRRTDGPYSYGYFPTDSHQDSGWSNDLSALGSSLMAYYEVTGKREALDYAIGFTKYFAEEWVPRFLDSEGRWKSGVWSSRLGTWLIGPLHVTGFEMLPGIYADEAGWGYSSLTCVDYFVRVFRVNGDPVLRERAVCSMGWCFDYCQFPDGAVGIHAQDDKWVGMTGGAIRQFAQLVNNNMLTREEQKQYLPKVHKAFRWLLKMTKPETFPPDGVVYVNRQTVPVPPMNVIGQFGLAALGLLDALWLFGGDKFTYNT